MNIELHLLQNFAPSCLNRDDTNAPKDCRFGGYRRARISSQCIKRSIRCGPDSPFREFVESAGRAVRTRRLIWDIAKRLDGSDEPTEATDKLVANVFDAGGLGRGDGKKETTLILFLPDESIDRMVALFQKSMKSLQDQDARVKELKKHAAKVKKDAGKDPSPELKKQIEAAKQAADDAKKAADNENKTLIDSLANELADSVAVPDIAMFGRMIEIDGKTPFGRRNLNIDAACQVAHALSTNKVDMEMDYFTAVDDLKTREDDAGAGMLGVVEYNSSCFYRYANINLPQLVTNLQGDVDLIRRTVGAFLRASVTAIPTGKQNTFAAHNSPSLVFAVVRKSGLWSLTNAFASPVRPQQDQSLIQRSIGALDSHWSQMTRCYGTDDVVTGALCSLEDKDLLTSTAAYHKDSLQDVIDTILGSLDLGDAGKEVA